MPKPLSSAAQRLVFGFLVVVLAGFGIYLSLDGLDGNGAEQTGDPAEESRGQGTKDATPPNPIPTVGTEDMDITEWLPFGEGDLKSAAMTAQSFASSYGSIDYKKSKENYYNSLKSFATEDYAKTLAQSSGAAALWGDKAEKKTVSDGRAKVDSIRSFSDTSVTFVVQTQSITKDADGTAEDLGKFAVTMVKEDGVWKVHDFQPADAANLGGG